ncbi:predicted protein [Naegleria gruberi]|uniref:Predicted protein n=1 Tax=Naegleria gruberi TaxID=5762 RepID=D2VR46_NAEGR|nr:uncharacterized protein NAEGRDRAFT_71458 [Naegleria gruberi]EFC40829.1 predicted protein [Naegleria gruberi]|eukprot:XP_002673573.1 predicted protein [Naegleria gruberi strain NEG-M]
MAKSSAFSAGMGKVAWNSSSLCKSRRNFHSSNILNFNRGLAPNHDKNVKQQQQHNASSSPSSLMENTKLQISTSTIEFINLISEQVNSRKEFIKATFSEPRQTTSINNGTTIREELNLGEVEIFKFSVRPIMMMDSKACFQFSLFLKDGKAIHRNFEDLSQVLRIIQELMDNASYQQVLIQRRGSAEDIHMLVKYDKETTKMKQVKVSKIANLAKATTSTRESSTVENEFSHNRKKDYILEEGKLINFLVELGIQHETSGKILAQKYNKFKQMNHFLEIFKESISSLLHQKGNVENMTLRIVDFGCGKSYLTFAIHYYLKEVLKIGNVQIIGLDLKKDVIQHCNNISKKYSYEKELKFMVGDIHSFDASSHFTAGEYKDDSQVDIVVSLHACNTATDKALEQATRWKSQIILAVPCCQHEVYQQMKHMKSLPENHFMEPLLQHNIFNEKFCSIYTDALRCQLLEIMGYKTNVIEFIDTEHTPKNVMIRATRSNTSPEKRSTLISKYRSMLDNLPVKITLEQLLFPKGLE